MTLADHPENETLRWPTTLDRTAIVQRLVQIRHAADAGGRTDLAALLADVEGFTAAQIGQAVIGAINRVQDDPAQSALASQLAMVAMNLKNLR